MARTIGSIVSEARGYLNDTVEEYRYSDDDLTLYLSEALMEIRRLRPDYFLGSYDTAVPSYTSSDLAENFPIDEQCVPAVVYYVTGSAELRDDEHTVDSRAGALLSAFAMKLTRAV